MSEKRSDSRQMTESQSKIPFGQLAAYGAGGIIPIALFNIAGILVGLMGNISLGLSAFWLGAILIIPRLWDALSDPIIGHLSDNTRTRWGRRRPFLLIGGLLVAVSFVAIWWIPKGEMVETWFPTEAGYQWFQLSYILITLLIFFTAVNIFEIPHGALGMELTSDYHERTRLFSAKSFVGNLFAMSTPWLFALANLEIFKGTGGNEADGMRYLSLMFAAVIIPLSYWWTYKLREPGFVKAAKHEKTPFWQDFKRTTGNRNFIMLTLTIFTLAMGFNFVQLLGSYIPIFYVFGGDKVAGAWLLGFNGTVWAITGLLAVFPLNWISPKLGKRKTLSIAIILMILAQLSKIVCYNPSHPYLIVIPTILLSIGMLFFFTLGSSMVGDICDEEELKTGYRTEGSFYSIFWWFIKMGTALASFVGGALIVFTMFDEAQVTKVDGIQGNIKELHAESVVWRDLKSGAANTASWLQLAQTESDEALEVTTKYITYLEKETQMDRENKHILLPNYPQERKDKLLLALETSKATKAGLENLIPALQQGSVANMDSVFQVAIPLMLQTRLEKAKMNAFELESHLISKSMESQKSKEHYESLLPIVATTSEQLRTMDLNIPGELLEQNLARMEKDLVALTQQSPYTLYMMRAVEIGLPILLSILSILFLLQYSLTEDRSHEIKNQLNKRNAESNHQ